MNNQETIIKKIEAIKAAQALIDELTKDMNADKDEIRAFMEAEGLDTYTASCYKVTYKEVVTNRFDAKALRNDLGNELADKYTVPTSSMRLTIK